MFAKEQGWVLSVDQASNCAGVSLWHNGILIACTTLNSKKSTDTLPRRLQTQVPQLTEFLQKYLPAGEMVTTVIFEGVRARLVALVVGAILTCPLLDKCRINQYASFVESSSWKKWARSHGATGTFEQIKGVKALREVGFPVDKYLLTSDDIADSILMYLTWRQKP